MTSDEIAVVIALGPKPAHARWLSDAVYSVVAQSWRPREVLLIDDMHGITQDTIEHYEKILWPTPFRVWQTPWLSGGSNAFNFGVNLARAEYSILLAADDELAPRAVEFSDRVLHQAQHKLAYYWYDVRYIGEDGKRAQLDGGDYPDQSTTSGPAMVSKALWDATGGYPPEAVVGHSDTIMLNSFIVHDLPFCGIDVTAKSDEGWVEPSYRARLHSNADHTVRSNTGWAHIIECVRDLTTDTWSKPEWGRYRVQP